jgi:quinol monooxygenase YgiN
VLVEVYRQPEDAVKHKETAHYLKWRAAVAEMMAEPRQGIKYNNLSPSDEGWD